MHIKKGDQVAVLTGKDRGKRGKVLTVMPKEGRALVEGINTQKRHQKPSQKVLQGGIVDQPGPVAVSNLMVVCPKCHKPSRRAVRVEPSGDKTRVCRHCQEEIDR